MTIPPNLPTFIYFYEHCCCLQSSPPMARALILGYFGSALSNSCSRTVGNRYWQLWVGDFCTMYMEGEAV